MNLESGEMKNVILWPAIILLSAVAVILTSRLTEPIRLWIVFWFMMVCPGMAFIRLMGIQDRTTEFIIAIALSLAIDTAVAEVLVLTEKWSIQGGILLLICLSLFGALLQIIHAIRFNSRRPQVQ
jgi:hypothetical protein